MCTKIYISAILIHSLFAKMSDKWTNGVGIGVGELVSSNIMENHQEKLLKFQSEIAEKHTIGGDKGRLVNFKVGKS